MQENKFKVGQLYEVTSSYEQGNIIEIVRVDDNYANYKIVKNNANVIVENTRFGVHSPWSRHLRLIDNIESIHIYRKGSEVKAILKNGKETVKEAVAKCSPTDEFDFLIGAKLAFERLVEKLKEETTPTIKIGDMVEVINCMKAYSTYDKWFGQTGNAKFLSHYVMNSSPKNGMKLKVVGMGEHERRNDMIYAVQNPETTQVFLIGKKGIKLVD